MNRLTLYLCLLLIGFACSSGGAPQPTVVAPAPLVTTPAAATTAIAAGDLSFLFRKDEAGLHVVVRFRGETSGRTELELPSEWGGETELWRGIENLRPTSPETTLVPGAAPQHPVLVHPPSAELELQYSLPTKPVAAELKDGENYRPLVHANWFHFIGHGLLVTPKWDDAEARSLQLRWEGLAPEVHIAHSFGVDLREQTLRTTLAKLRHAVFVGGDFRVLVADVRGKPVNVAMRGDWKFSDAEFLDLVRTIVSTERDFFNDHDFDRFLITLIPTGSGCCSYGGTGLTDSFATFINSNLGIEGRMKHLLSHELFHTWNGRRIQRQQPEELVYWFSEGFTDYFSDALLLRSGLISYEEAVANYNKVLRLYYLSPVRNVPNERIRQDFWNNRDVERLPYQRGNILAHEWNFKIRAAHPDRSLDDLMRALLKDAMSEGAVVSPEKIDALMSQYLPSGVAEDLERYIDRGETLVVSAGSMGPCATLVQEQLGPFELGYDEEAADRDGLLRGVTKNGPAYRAGAREGMKLKHSRYSGDITRPVELTVIDPQARADSPARVLRYLPQGPKQPVPQFRVDAAKIAAGTRCF
jgi:predicted metalloprotease with PDZ domain